MLLMLLVSLRRNRPFLSHTHLTGGLAGRVVSQSPFRRAVAGADSTRAPFPTPPPRDRARLQWQRRARARRPGVRPLRRSVPERLPRPPRDNAGPGASLRSSDDGALPEFGGGRDVHGLVLRAAARRRADHDHRLQLCGRARHRRLAPVHRGRRRGTAAARPLSVGPRVSPFERTAHRVVGQPVHLAGGTLTPSRWRLDVTFLGEEASEAPWT